MQANSIKNVPEAERRKYLRVATINKEVAPLFFLYIGKNESSIKFLLSTAISGIIAENYTNAKKLIKSENFDEHNIDVIIVDLAYDLNELSDFKQFLKSCGNEHGAIPIIYNDQYLSEPDFRSCANIVDDVINLANWQFDFQGKISFLKKVKEYNTPINEKDYKVEVDTNIFKRVFDVVVSSLLLLIALPLFLLIAIAIKIESKGPVFYNAKRAGRGFKIFRFYKFRTMVVNADKHIEKLAHLNQYSASENGPAFFKLNNDPRVTRVGRFLRNTSLDELPQFFNVLKGDMSMVGNRPLPLYEAATLTTNEFVERFVAPAGITGLWQIKKRGRAEMSIEERINLDITYARESNILYDLRIMANTPAALIQKTSV